MLLSVLPDEVWEQILLNLDLSSITRCNRVCQSLKTLINASTTIQYHCECLLTGMEYVGHPSASIHERLEALRKHRLSWETLNWVQAKGENMPSGINYEYTGGVLGILREHNFSTLSFPSHISQENRTTEQTIPFSASDFLLDPSQDLVIFIQREQSPTPIRIFSLATLTPHPNAMYSDIETMLPLPPHHYGFKLYLMGDLFCLCAWKTRLSHLRIWDWKTGEQIVSDDYDPGTIGTECFAFVSKDIYLVVRDEGPGYISIYRMAPHREVARLVFPELAQGVSLYSASFYETLAPKNPPTDHQFATSLENKAYAIRLNHTKPDYYSQLKSPLFAFILAKTFLSYGSNDSCGSTVNTIPWDAWGPDNVHITMPYQGPNFRWPHSANIGSKFVLSLDSKDYNIRVLDFMNVKRPLRDSTTIISDPLRFKEDIVCRLPYRIYQRPAPPELASTTTSFMIDERRIIGVLHMGNRSELHPLLL